MLLPSRKWETLGKRQHYLGCKVSSKVKIELLRETSDYNRTKKLITFRSIQVLTEKKRTIDVTIQACGKDELFA